IPDSVQGVLAARIDLLSSPAKTALQAAAVIGRSFSPPALASLVGSAAEVRTLVERGFIRPTEPDLVFKHALTREVAYGSLPEDGGIWHEIGRVNALKFDGEAYWEAMLKAVDLTSKPESLAELYGDLAFESTMRGAMWKRAPDDELVLGWIDKALELAGPESRAFAYASIARGMRESDVPATERAISIAERLDDVE